jgi:hypothetical protein
MGFHGLRERGASITCSELAENARNISSPTMLSPRLFFSILLGAAFGVFLRNSFRYVRLGFALGLGPRVRSRRVGRRPCCVSLFCHYIHI